MNAHPSDEQLQDFVDGALPGAARTPVASHLTTCATCRGIEARLRALAGETASLPRSIEPPRDLWPAIQARISTATDVQSRSRRPTPWRRWGGLAAAAVGLMALSSAITWQIARQHRGTPLAESGALPAELRVIEANYVQATDDLAGVVASERNLAPETVAVLQRNLRIIDDAILEARAALARDPSNSDLARMLWGAYGGKLDLLQRASRLTVGS